MSDARDPAGHEKTEYVTVFETHDMGEFLAARSALEAAGIPVISPDRLSVPGLSAGSVDPAGQPGHLRVPREHASAAREVLAGR
ncbi:MAG: hypothetical protein DWQ36_14130 [Acidobacteria bacterium]|nr:MAG: hypothetical protein DWQ30_19820 [Acidobacteriota bacterium]REK06343.1 MAG: hypothetical protein DWQ36_14130 [Acidobacteriota bacterium]